MIAVEWPDPRASLARPAEGTQGGSAVLIGPRTRARYVEARDEPRCVITPVPAEVAASLAGRPLRDLADGELPLELDGAALPASVTAAGPLREAVAWLAGGGSVAGAARLAGVGERRLRAAFAEAVGVSPRTVQRLVRVRRVLQHPDVPLAELAVLAGYYDQSHLTAEFRKVMGVPPGAFRAGRWPEPVPCGPRPRPR